jgi:hypothetical protein
MFTAGRSRFQLIHHPNMVFPGVNTPLATNRRLRRLCGLRDLSCLRTLGPAVPNFNLTPRDPQEKRRMTKFRGLVVACVAAMMFASAATNPVDAGLFHHSAKDCCEPAPVCCEPAPVCCPPPPAEVNWCVVDPCTGCSYNVSACVPACCAGTLPCLDGCRKGMFGRKILTYKFACCDHCVDVVVTKRGRTIVRD